LILLFLLQKQSEQGEFLVGICRFLLLAKKMVFFDHHFYSVNFVF